ncbi:MAG: hypothetical protein Q8O60_05150 [Deltaproteobacteria bacterium]|nr:hypothetical protein [Deltaproteobacteria bacterium]MDP3029401.1 hypothetical protein [Deltaproteobacteria bacterium]
MDKKTASRVYQERLEDLKNMPKDLVQKLTSGVKDPWTKIFLTEPDPQKWPPGMYEILRPYLEKG